MIESVGHQIAVDVVQPQDGAIWAEGQVPLGQLGQGGGIAGGRDYKPCFRAQPVQHLRKRAGLARLGVADGHDEPLACREQLRYRRVDPLPGNVGRLRVLGRDVLRGGDPHVVDGSLAHGGETAVRQ